MGEHKHQDVQTEENPVTVTPEETTPQEEQFSIARMLRGRDILMTGATGFLGKVAASMLLHRHPDIGHLYLLVRAGRTQSAKARFWSDIAGSPVFDPIREVYSDGFVDFIEDKVTILSGDISQEGLGLDEETTKDLQEKLDLVINSAGLTDFSPSLEQAIKINTLGSGNVLKFAMGCKKAALQHVSTTYVTGRRSGVISEDQIPYGFYPKADELKINFSPERELEDCHTLIEQVYRQADDQERRAMFVREAREYLKEQGRDPQNEQALEDRILVERKNWIRRTLRAEGTRRADHWGWNNTYTYSKSLGEQFLSLHKDKLPISIVRPAVIESSVSYPAPGWNQGINTTSPLAYLLWKGVRFVPTQDNLRMDVIPVDHVASGMIAVAAAQIARKHEFIYQMASSDRNPVTVTRLVELTSLWSRQHYQKKTRGSKVQNFILSNWESSTVDHKKWSRFSAPAVKSLTAGIDGFLGNLGKTGFNGLDNTLLGVRKITRQVKKQSALVDAIIRVFLPFIHDTYFVFEANATKRLDDLLPPEEKHWNFRIDEVDWREYWMGIHLPGLYRNVFPEIEEKFSAARDKEIYTAEDLIEVFDTAVGGYRSRVAFQQITPNGLRRFTYEQIQEHARWAAKNLEAAGTSKGSRILIMSENRPEWGMTYFGILYADATAVPVDSELSVHEVINLVKSCEAFGIVLSEKVRGRLESEGLKEALAALKEQQEKPLDVQLFNYNYLFTEPEEEEEAEVTALARRPESIASLIYTSGTTGSPKGVMLSHENFTALLSSIHQMFDVSDRDTFLSVLPLHHTFEFTCGFLLPVSKGATITYLDELSSESLKQAFEETQVTAMVGVPALWQLLHRKILSDVSARGPAAKTAFDSLVEFNSWLRERFGLNWGHTLFAPVHKGFGGKIRYLISGGASLPAPIMETFQGLGFELLEGYGLTEAAPVLTCARPGHTYRRGTVGLPLPGVEVKIKDPDATGVGEIIAKGGNVMQGYFNNPEATKAVITEDGWLRTGDLGRIDSKGHLVISGRQKETIVASNGENVYPDELEETYGGCKHVDEFSIVGLPDGKGSERVACMVHPKVEDDGDLSRDQVIAEIRKHFDLKAARLPYYQRVKTLRFSADPLPRTATRKVKRKEVQAIMIELEESSNQTSSAQHQAEDWGRWAWMRQSVADLAGKGLEEVSLHQSLVDDLGFDSLAFTELAQAIEKHTGIATSSEDLLPLNTLEDVIALASSADHGKAPRERKEEGNHLSGFTHLPSAMRPQSARRPAQEEEKDKLVEVPKPVRDGLMNSLGFAQELVYSDLFDVKIYGKAHIPYHTNAIVAANHCSHLDMGLIKYALKDWAPNLATLAASDYFFDTKAKRTYFGQFTNLIPVERSGSLESSMARVSEVVSNGKPLLLFPEGTRSKSGDISEFRPGIGFLSLHNKTGVLPLYLSGTHRALPKGSMIPRRRRLTVHVGEMIPYEFLAEATQGMSQRDANIKASQLIREAVLALKAGRRFLASEEEQNRKPSPGDAIREMLSTLPEKCQHANVESPITYYFSLGNDEDAKWTLSVTPTQCTFQKGKPAQGADCVVKTNPDMLRKMIVEAYVPTMDEFMSGKIKTNNPSLLMTFQHVFGL